MAIVNSTRVRLSDEDRALMLLCAQRATRIARAFKVRYPLIDAQLDLTVTHTHGCALDFAGLLAARDSDFAHDVFGINAHLDRRTGELKDCFVPRFARSNQPLAVA